MSEQDSQDVIRMSLKRFNRVRLVRCRGIEGRVLGVSFYAPLPPEHDPATHRLDCPDFNRLVVTPRTETLRIRSPRDVRDAHRVSFERFDMFREHRVPEPDGLVRSFSFGAV
jgi:hypothetical protein